MKSSRFPFVRDSDDDDDGDEEQNDHDVVTCNTANHIITARLYGRQSNVSTDRQS